MDKDFIPKKIVENNIEYVLFDNVFRMDETISYAVRHNFNIKFICTTYTCACEILTEIQESGYSLLFKKVPVYMEGRIIYYNIEVFCSKIL
jgi:hypothetical protein